MTKFGSVLPLNHSSIASQNREALDLVIEDVALGCHDFADVILAVLKGLVQVWKEFPFPIICDAPGVLYSYLGVEQARGLLSWSFSAQRIYKSARDAGYHYDRNAPQILPMTLIVGHEGKILFTHSGRSQTDLPEDCIAIRELAREVVHTKAADQRRASHHCSDETLTLPDLIGWDDVDNDQ